MSAGSTQNCRIANCCLWIANDASGVAAGMVRFEQRDQEALVSVILDKSGAGKTSARY
jgi:hypothetical protein